MAAGANVPTTTAKPKILGYLPNDVPPFGQIVLLGFQHVLTMFPATVLCAILMKFPVSTVLTVTGFATVVVLLVSKLTLGVYIPLYYGSSFSYISAVAGMMAVLGVAADASVAPPEAIAVVTAGFIATAIINVLIGIVIRFSGGKKAVDFVLPPIVTGAVACTIGIGLGAAALSMASGTCCGVTDPNTQLKWWAAATVTLAAAYILSVYLQGRGFIGMLPILLAAIIGYIVAIPLGLVNLSSFGTEAVLRAPTITFPTFAHPLTVTAIVGIGIMAIATIPESTAHLYQISLYVDHLAEEQERPKYGLANLIGFNLMLDGLNDFINGLFGSTAGTNYGENNSLMVITRNYAGPALVAAGIIAVLLGFIGPLAEVIGSIPTAVSGGLAIYLFGVIGMQGIALMMAERVNLYDPKQLAIGAVILIVGIGGNIGFPNGFLPIPLLTGIFPNGWPAIATAAVLGILMNLLTVFWKPPTERAQVMR